MQTGKVLVLGGGYVGSRFCISHPNGTITTATSEEKVSSLTSKGVQCFKWKIEDEKTWVNLPQRDSVRAVLLTFAVSMSHASALQRLLNLYVGVPFICWGTTSVFSSYRSDSGITEINPLTGLGVNGQPLTDRVNAENILIEGGAAILHLSGICDFEKRNVCSFVVRFKNGLNTINLIHVEDIIKITNVAIDKFKEVTRQRFIVTSGAYRANDLLSSLGLQTIPESPESLEENKLLSNYKIRRLLSADYRFELPVENFDETKVIKFSPNALLNYQNFLLQSGRWLGDWIRHQPSTKNISRFRSIRALTIKEPGVEMEHINLYFADQKNATPELRAFRGYHLNFSVTETGVTAVDLPIAHRLLMFKNRCGLMICINSIGYEAYFIVRNVRFSVVGVSQFSYIREVEAQEENQLEFSVPLFPWTENAIFSDPIPVQEVDPNEFNLPAGEWEIIDYPSLARKTIQTNAESPILHDFVMREGNTIFRLPDGVSIVGPRDFNTSPNEYSVSIIWKCEPLGFQRVISFHIINGVTYQAQCYHSN